MSTKRDYYEILSVPKTSTAAEIKSAYRKMALKFHPDKNKAADAEEKFKEINEAYQVLSDTKKRQTYDQFGHAAFDPASGMGGSGGNPFTGGSQSGPFTWSYSTGGGQAGNPFDNVDFGDPFDIFESFFGGAHQGGRARARYSLTIEFLEAVQGVEKKVAIEGKQHTIKVPPGADNGTRLRFEEFDVTLDVRTHPRFKREHFDLFVDQPISFTTATLGGTAEVKTIDTTLTLKVRPGTPSHTLVRLRGEGIQHLQARGKGDLYVRLIVEVPQKLSKEQKKALETLQIVGI